MTTEDPGFQLPAARLPFTWQAVRELNQNYNPTGEATKLIDSATEMLVKNSEMLVDQFVRAGDENSETRTKLLLLLGKTDQQLKELTQQSLVRQFFQQYIQNAKTATTRYASRDNAALDEESDAQATLEDIIEGRISSGMSVARLEEYVAHNSTESSGRGMLSILGQTVLEKYESGAAELPAVGNPENSPVQEFRENVWATKFPEKALQSGSQWAKWLSEEIGDYKDTSGLRDEVLAYLKELEEEAGEADDDITVSDQTISLKCPLTMAYFVNPVTSSVCQHSFEKDAIREVIGSGQNRVKCPIPACDKAISFSDLKPNRALKRRVEIFTAQQNVRRQEESDIARLD